MPRALFSVYDKTGICDLACVVSRLGIEILSTGGTYDCLKEAHIPVTQVSDVTTFPEILGGRVKTLHPMIHGGLLADHRSADHMATLAEQGIEPINLLAVNLYPFKETVKSGASQADVIENIDIGGVALLRAAAKNGEQVIVLSDVSDYGRIISELESQGEVSLATKRYLQAKAFAYTAHYDAMISRYFAEQLNQGIQLPDKLTLAYDKVQNLRYGENAQQKAALYQPSLKREEGITDIKQLHGKKLSYNNWRDVEAALALCREFDQPVAAAIKHNNPCGVAIGETIEAAFAACYAADPTSIFGGIVITNRPIDLSLAEALHGIFLEIIIAPAYSEAAFDLLSQKKHLRLLETRLMQGASTPQLEVLSLTGGLLLQTSDHQLYADEVKLVTKRNVSPEERADLAFAWRVVKHVKSNAIVLAKGQQTIGIGAGQMNRVGALEIAIKDARARGFDLKGSVLASDAFFPMADTLALAASVGVGAVIQPGGSIKDADSIAVANRYEMAMLHTGQRHFKH